MDQSNRVRIVDEGIGGDLRVRAPFELKEELKATGGRWDPVHRGWTVPRPNLAELVAVLRYLGVEYDLVELAPARKARPAASTTWAESMFASLPEHLREPAYRALAKVLHPDIGGDKEAAQQLIGAYSKRRAA